MKMDEDVNWMIKNILHLNVCVCVCVRGRGGACECVCVILIERVWGVCWG